ncbi:MAG: translation initiation factor IF-6 [Candidatus Bilamarchaeaceae archaeon]
MRTTSYFGNPWIGAFARTTETHTFVPRDSPPRFIGAVETLGTEVVNVSVGASNLVGAYTAANSKGIVLPNVASSEEAEMFRKAGLNVEISRCHLNAHGNNIAVNDKVGIINPEIHHEDRKRMEDALGVELVPFSLDGYPTIGSCVLLGARGALVHFAAKPDELERLKAIVKAPCIVGSVNTGVGFVGLGVIATSKTYIAGEKTTAFELGRVEEALDLIK